MINTVEIVRRSLMLTFKEYINEAWGRDTWEAIKKHYRIERSGQFKPKNVMMHPASLASLGALFAATPVKHMLSSGSDPHALALAAGGVALAGAASINHFKDIINIRKKIKASRKRQEEWKASG